MWDVSLASQREGNPPPPGLPPGKNTVQVILLMGRYAALELHVSAYRMALDMGSGAREGGGFNTALLFLWGEPWR